MTFMIGMACFALSAMISVTAYSFEINGRYLNYGNGMINMDNVTHISARINYVVTLPHDQAQDYFKQFGASNVSDPAQRLNLQRWFNSKYLDDLDYYFVEIEAYIKFDDFTLTMIPKQRYLKLPSDQDMERVRAAYGDHKFMQFFEHIQNQQNEFKSASILSQSDSSKIHSLLFDLSNGYDKIYDSSSGSWWPF